MFVAPLARQILHRRLFSGLILESLLSGELAYNEQLNERLFTLIVNVPQEKFLKGLLISNPISYCIFEWASQGSRVSQMYSVHPDLI